MIIFLDEVGNIFNVNSPLCPPIGKQLGWKRVIKVLFRHWVYFEYHLPLVIPTSPVNIPPGTPTRILSVSAIISQLRIYPVPSMLKFFIYIPQNCRLEVAVIGVVLSEKVLCLVPQVKLIPNGGE